MMNKKILTTIIVLTTIGCSMQGISISKKGYDDMVKKVTCFHITLKNATSYTAHVNGNQVIKPNEHVIVFEQCLNEYSRLARSLGHEMEEPIKIIVSLNGNEYSVPVGARTLENNYAFKIIQTTQGIEIQEDTTPTIPTPGARPAAGMLNQVEIISPGDPEEVIK